MKVSLLSASCALLLAFGSLQTQSPPKPIPLEAGAAAPLFHLNDHSGQTVTVGGKQAFWTVLAFYPKALTPG